MTQPLSPAAPSSLSSLGAAQTGEGARVSIERPAIFIEREIAENDSADTPRTSTEARTRNCQAGKSKLLEPTIPEVSAISPSNTPYSDTCHASFGKATVVIDTVSEPGSWARHLRHTAAMREGR
jgi:hypothetical protein